MTYSESAEGVTINSAHCLTMKYCGPTNSTASRYRVSWEGWPSEGPTRKVARFIPYDYSGNRDATMAKAAAMFAEWLGNMPGDNRKRVYAVESITWGGLSSDSYVLLVNLARES